MPGWVFKDGKFEQLKAPVVMVDGQLKNADIYTKVNNEIRIIYGRVSANDIAGFKLIYTLDNTKQHNVLDHLKYNSDIVYNINTTDGGNIYNLNSKGIIFDFDELRYDEGIIFYEGVLYAILNNGMLLQLTNNSISNLKDKRVLVTEAMEFTLCATYETRYEIRGYNMYGWNKMFSSNTFLPKSNDTKELKSESLLYDDTTIYSDKLKEKVGLCEIGIACDTHNKDVHMIGTKGTLSQFVYQITVNEEPKPFTIEII